MNSTNLSNAGGFTLRNGNTQVTTPAPSQSTWDTLLAVLAGAAIAIAAGMAQAHCSRSDDD